MRSDKQAQLTIRDLGKMTKKDVRQLTSWLKTQVKNLESLTAKDKLWLIKRRDYAPLFNMSLMK